MPGPETQPLFDAAKKLGIGFCLGYAELVEEGGRVRRFNTAITVDKGGRVVAKYRKIHLPGHAEHEPWRRFQHLEKRYFEVGNLGFAAFRASFGRARPASSAWRSATTGAGPRPTASWACRAWR